MKIVTGLNGLNKSSLSGRSGNPLFSTKGVRAMKTMHMLGFTERTVVLPLTNPFAKEELELTTAGAISAPIVEGGAPGSYIAP